MRKKRKSRPKSKIGKKSRPKSKKSVLKKIAKVHALFTGLVLALYFAVGFWLGPGALKQDIKGKVAGASAVLSLHIAGPPGKPDVSTLAGCNGANQYIRLNWHATNDTDSYDIYRNGILLVSGLAGTNYSDENVVLATGYSYYIIANGPLGSTQSDTVSETAPSECYVPPPPPPPSEEMEVANCRITTFDKIDLANWRCLAETNKRRPLFTGTSNVASADIQLEVKYQIRKRNLVVNLSANENGYWSYRPSRKNKLTRSTKNIFIRVTDASDSSRNATCSLKFKITKKKISREGSKLCTGAAVSQKPSPPNEFTFSPGIELSVKNEKRAVFSGENLAFELKSPLGQPESDVNYEIYNSKNEFVFSPPAKKISSTENTLALPLHLNPGEYKLSAGAATVGTNWNAVETFEVREKPIFEIGNNFSLTYTQLLSNLSWAVIILTAIMLVFFGLLGLEYHLSRYAVFQVTEGELKKDGYVD